MVDVKCKHCGSEEVGKKATLILRYDTSMLGPFEGGYSMDEQGFKDLFDGMERKARGEEITSKNVIDIVIDDGYYCFACDKYQ